jgi:uncharacterized membrane protein
MSWYVVFRFLHIISAIWFVGGLFSRQLVRRYLKQTDDIQQLAIFSQAAGKIETGMVIPGSMAVVVIGVILAVIAGYPIFGFLQGASQNWLLVANILLVTAMGLVPTVFVPRGKKFEPVLQSALAEGRITPELRAAIDDPVVKLAHLYEQVSVIIVVALMVFKPF